MFTNWIHRLFVTGKTAECGVCSVLKEQLDYERAQNKELIETITTLLKPAPVIQQAQGEPRPVVHRGVTWTRRRRELETADRLKAEADRKAAKPDSEVKPPESKPQESQAADKIDNQTIKPGMSVEQLEMELGVTESEGVH